MVYVFWDFQGYKRNSAGTLPEKGLHYYSILVCWWFETAMGGNSEELVWKLTRGVLSYQDNALVHDSKVTMAAMQECRVEHLTWFVNLRELPLPEDKEIAQWSPF